MRSPGHAAAPVTPGFIRIPMLRSTMGHDFMRDDAERAHKETRMHRLSTTSEMAGVSFFLAVEEDRSFVTRHRHGLLELLGLA